MAKENKARTKMRKNRVTLDQQYYGTEPVYTDTLTLDEEVRGNLWVKGANYYNYFYKMKDYIPAITSYAKHLGYTKKQIAQLRKMPDWKFIKISKSAQLWVRGYEYTDEEIVRHKEWYNEYLIEAKQYDVQKKEKEKVVKPTPAQLSYNKMIDTIWSDWDEQVVDKWMDYEYDIKFPLYNLWMGHGLKGNVIQKFREFIQYEYDVVSDAYNKTCEQAIENYSHVSKGNLKKMMKTMENMFDDLERLKLSFKAKRGPRMRKPKASDVQVRKLKYKSEDVDAKLVSINPILIPGKKKVFVFNTKQRKLTEYVTNSVKGFTVSGSTLKNIDTELSRTTVLRKPEEVLPNILNKTEKQIDNIWESLTTKISKPNGRINADCVLLRVIE